VGSLRPDAPPQKAGGFRARAVWQTERSESCVVLDRWSSSVRRSNARPRNHGLGIKQVPPTVVIAAARGSRRAGEQVDQMRILGGLLEDPAQVDCGLSDGQACFVRWRCTAQAG